MPVTIPAFGIIYIIQTNSNNLPNPSYRYQVALDKQTNDVYIANTQIGGQGSSENMEIGDDFTLNAALHLTRNLR